MIGLRGLALGALTGAAMLLGTAHASAQAATAERASVGGGLRYGLEMNDGDGNPWGLGFGARGGYTLDMGLYLGGAFEYYLGESESQQTLLGEMSVSVNIWQLMFEVGYDVGVGDSFVIRPKAGLGLASANAEVCVLGACSSDSEMHALIAPGADFLFVGDGFWVGPEVRFDMVLSDPMAKALVMGVSGGASF